MMFLLFFILINYTAQFQIGYDYEYEYESNLSLLLPYSNQSVAYLTLIRFRIINFDNNLYLKIYNVDRNPGLSDQTQQHLVLYPVRFEIMENGKIKDKIFIDENDSPSSILVKKSIISLFDYDQSTKQDLFYGNCDVQIQSINENKDLKHFKKEKSNCKKKIDLKGEYKRKEKILNSILNRNISTEIKVSEKVIQNSSTDEKIKIYIEFNENSSIHVVVNQIMKLISVKKIDSYFNDLTKDRILSNVASELINLNLKINGLMYDSEEKIKIEKTFEKSLKKFGKKLKLGSLETTEKFIETIKIIRKYFKRESKKLDNTLMNLIDKDKIGKFLLEVYTASQTEEALNSISKTLGISNLLTDDHLLNEKESKLIEEFLFGSALASPNPKTHSLIQIINSNCNKITFIDAKEKSHLALGSTLTSNNGDQFFESINNELLKCNNENCKIKLLEALKNSKLNSIENLILKYFNTNCTIQPNVCLFAIKGLSQLNIDENFELFGKLFEIFSSNKYSVELRIEALNILFSKYQNTMRTEAVIYNILNSIEKEINKNHKSNQFVVYVKNVLLNQIDVLRLIGNSSLKLNEFDFLVQNGGSYSMTSMIKKYSSGSLGYNMNQLISEDGSFKALDFSISFQENCGNRLDFLKFELFADHLNILTSKTKDKTEKKDPYANLHLSIMGQKLKIVELFKGYTSMLSLLWSLPTTPTSLFNINFLVNDQNEYFVLSNGMILRVETIGAVSINLEGVTEISLWSQYAKINVKNLASLYNEQKVYLINDFKILNQINSNFKTQFLIDFYQNTDFKTSPYEICIKMSQEKFSLKESIQLVDFEFKVVQEIKKIKSIQPSTFMFSRDLVKFC